MKNRLRMALLLASSLTFSGSVGAADDAPSAPAAAGSAPMRLAQATKESVEKRLSLVSTLIENSSAAKQVESSGDTAAKERQNKARDLHRQASDAYKAGDYSKASKLLDDSAKQMMGGVRLATPEQVTAGKKRADFDAKMESVNALLSAQKRISTEKGAGKDSADTSRQIEKLMQEAKDLAAANKFDEGRARLDQAYLLTKASVSSMRSGDTLVRSLNFANKEEEYHYEVDRNDTHQMLVKVLLDEKRESTPGLEKTVKGFTDKAADLRSQAEKLAGKKDFQGAIGLLEDSTKELVRAIRSAGIYIPG